MCHPKTVGEAEADRIEDMDVQGRWSGIENGAAYTEEQTIGSVLLDPKNMPEELEIDGHTYYSESEVHIALLKVEQGR